MMLLKYLVKILMSKLKAAWCCSFEFALGNYINSFAKQAIGYFLFLPASLLLGVLLFFAASLFSL